MGDEYDPAYLNYMIMKLLKTEEKYFDQKDLFDYFKQTFDKVEK